MKTNCRPECTTLCKHNKAIHYLTRKKGTELISEQKYIHICVLAVISTVWDKNVWWSRLYKLGYHKFLLTWFQSTPFISHLLTYTKTHLLASEQQKVFKTVFGPQPECPSMISLFVTSRCFNL